MLRKILLLLSLIMSTAMSSQQIKMYERFVGQYDFTMVGNTLNPNENNDDAMGGGGPCTMLSQSSADLNIANNQVVKKAYLYWGGSASLANADLDVKLNGVDIKPSRTFSTVMNLEGSTYEFFSAFADVTQQVLVTGNGSYTFSDFDILKTLGRYCEMGVNYGGWAITIIYEDTSIPIRTIAIYDGLEGISSEKPIINIRLDGLNITDTRDAKLGVLLWEGDAGLAITEEFRINGNLVNVPPLNPSDNAFNGSNSFTGKLGMYNMDLDLFSMSKDIELGDKAVNVMMRTGRDMVIANEFVVAVSSQSPDATIKIDNVQTQCDSRTIRVNYTVSNTEGMDDLLMNIPIAFYRGNQLLGKSATKKVIPIGESEKGTIDLAIPSNFPNTFTLTAKVDDDGTGKGIVTEVDETNNTDEEEVSFKSSPRIKKPVNISECDTDNDGKLTFDLTSKQNEIITGNNYAFTYHETQEDAISKSKMLQKVTNYEINNYAVKTIWVRVEDKTSGCFSITSFDITTKKQALAGINQPLMICNNKTIPSLVDLTAAEFLFRREVNYVDELTINYYQSKSDAEREINEIQNIIAYQPMSYPETIYVKAKGKGVLWCDNIIEIQMNDCIVPKGISPNWDGMNDYLDLSMFNLEDLRIYNRYGKEVYKHGFGYTNQWHGQDNSNKLLPAGTYYYSIKTLFETYVGYIYIVREVK